MNCIPLIVFWFIILIKYDIKGTVAVKVCHFFSCSKIRQFAILLLEMYPDHSAVLYTLYFIQFYMFRPDSEMNFGHSCDKLVLALG